MTAGYPLNSLLLNQSAVESRVHRGATHCFIPASNVISIVIELVKLIKWDMNEKKAFALSFICDLQLLLSEPLNLVGHHTAIARYVKALIISGV